jgi:hypothetical protein
MNIRKRDVKSETNRIHYIQLYSKCAKIGLYERRTLNQFPACPEQENLYKPTKIMNIERYSIEFERGPPGLGVTISKI